MKAYVHASPAGAETRILSQCFGDFAELYRHGILSDTSTVWVNAESPDVGFWALTDRSQYIHLHRVSEPGYARLTKGRIRWAPSYNDTTSRPLLDLDASVLTKNPDAAVTLVVKHRDRRSSVTVINDKKLELTDGQCTLNNLTVIDLGSYVAPVAGHAAPPVFEQNDAQYQGSNHLLLRLNTANAELVRKHLDLFAFDISAEQLQSINTHLDVVDRYAGTFADALFQRLQASLIPSGS